MSKECVPEAVVVHEMFTDCVPAAANTRGGGTGGVAPSLLIQCKFTVPAPFTVMLAVVVKPLHPPTFEKVTLVTANAAGAGVSVLVGSAGFCDLICT